MTLNANTLIHFSVCPDFCGLKYALYGEKVNIKARMKDVWCDRMHRKIDKFVVNMNKNRVKHLVDSQGVFETLDMIMEENGDEFAMDILKRKPEARYKVLAYHIIEAWIMSFDDRFMEVYREYVEECGSQESDDDECLVSDWTDSEDDENQENQ